MRRNHRKELVSLYFRSTASSLGEQHRSWHFPLATMMILDSVSEKLRSKHVRTLELLQKTLDENVELREQVARLQKVRRGCANVVQVARA